MSDTNTEKRPRSAINALKVVNQLRESKGLPKVSNKPKAVSITPEIKLEITRQEIERLFPEALIESQYQFTEDQAKKLVKEVEFRLARVKAGKEAAPDVVSAPRKPRGRPRQKA